MTESPSWWWFNNNFLPPQKKNPYPRNNPINYGVNSLGYRCPEFELIDWKNSYVMLGGSDVFGEGLEDNQTMTHHLEKMLDEPVINLAFAAASNQHIVLTMAMLARYHTPKKWIIGWGDSCRWLHWNTETTDIYDVQAHRGPHKEFCQDPFPQLLDALPWYSSQARVMAQAISQGNLIELGAESIPILKEWEVDGMPYIDHGSVTDHAGEETHKMVAQWLYKKIKNEADI